MKYRVAWESKITGFKGHGNWLDDYSLADSQCKYGNEKFTFISHWVEPYIKFKEKKEDNDAKTKK